MNRFTWPETPSLKAFQIAKPGIPFILVACVSTLFLAVIQFNTLALLSFFITLFVCYFFRDPDRAVEEGVGYLSSPADGKVIFADVVDENPYIDGKCFKISIFMNVFNVHVNRVPFGGIIKAIHYHPGKFFNASLDKASKHNERNALVIETESGVTFATVQIAGLVARRIICGVKEGDTVVQGRRFGMICFGSRLDLYLPTDFACRVSIGEKVQAGTTVMGVLS
ncbi:phosphatidylserine decarboxylase family protein [Desulfoluna sp.]|uniref:phosphatidylserine decarboxylase family protein n=1 Tax=Desulfoluna sp. TaxID=2045199 RepID=UPI0026131820|nr:phosphatidylserine decarboxylase family protein [Desulfoluna sp.]